VAASGKIRKNETVFSVEDEIKQKHNNSTSLAARAACSRPVTKFNRLRSTGIPSSSKITIVCNTQELSCGYKKAASKRNASFTHAKS
jgi:hypothetical protein